MIELVCGLPGQGKSLMAAKTVRDLVRRNLAWERKTGIKRRIASNMPFSPEYTARYPDMFVYWTDIDDVVAMQDVDVIFDEVANKFDARNWVNLPEKVKWWLRHHDKDGIEIYANTQHFEAVDVQFRRLVNRLYVVSKIIGSARPAATRPLPKRIWGVIMVRQHDPRTYAFESDTGENVRSAFGIPSFFFINRELVDIYDTRYKILGDDSSTFRHSIKKCPDCGLERVVHT